MPDKKLTDAEIVKALECCSVQGHFVCDECPAWVDSNCIGTHKQTLDLINRLQAENERLKKCRKDEVYKIVSAIDKVICETKAEAYNEFAEWLYSLFPTENSEIVVISRTGIAKKVNELLDKRSD